jgi:hypothetical protein
MSIIRRLGKAAFVSSAFAVLVFGATSLFAPRAEAIPPHPIFLCGPTYLWVCTGPGGVPEILFPGTLCERARFERRTGLTCVPS